MKGDTAAGRDGAVRTRLEVSVERLVWGGDGLGRADGKVVFVPFTAPGDVALVRIVEEHRSFSRGRIVRLLREGPGRTSPPCPLFGQCGGCQWQHLAYGRQLTAKSGILHETLRRVGRLPPPGETEVLPSPRQYRYRHRARLHASRRAGRAAFGFFRTRSREVVPLDDCLLLHEPLAEILRGLRDIVNSSPGQFEGLSHLDLSTDFAGRSVSLDLRSGQGRMGIPEELQGKFAALASRGGIEIILPGREQPALALGPGVASLQTGGGAFSQVNLAQNERLVREALSLLSPSRGDRILDLFCGIGNFTIPAASAGAEVLGVDSSHQAVRSARANADRLGAGGAEFLHGRADEAVRSLADRGRSFDTVILNPPRTGCREAIEGLGTLGPSRVLMVSCDPATFSRDASLLTSGGFRLAVLRALDLFPQTYHFETLGLFLR